MSNQLSPPPRVMIPLDALFCGPQRGGETLDTCSAEFLIEPFEVGKPGPHVTAAVQAVRDLGFEPEMGPFGTTIEGAHEEVIEAVKQLLDAATAAGASRISLQISTCSDE